MKTMPGDGRGLHISQGTLYDANDDLYFPN